MKLQKNFFQLSISRAGRNILLRSFFFIFVLFSYYWVRNIVTDSLFGYIFTPSDGFVTYSFYALAALFVFINWEKLLSFKVQIKTSEIIIFFSLAFSLLFFSLETFISPKSVDFIFGEYIFRFLAGFSLFLLFFGVRFLKTFFQEVAFLVTILFLLKISPILVDHFWEYSSAITLVGLKLLLPLTGVPYVIDSDEYRVKIADFAAYVGPACAGIYSLIAFTMLFLFTLFLLLQRKYILRTPYLLGMFLAGLAGVFVLNTIRVLSILLVGAYYSRDFAINAFHNNIGAILFLLFFVIYITLFLKRAIKK